MNIYAALQKILYVISDALLYPVMIFLIIGCAWVMIYSGSFTAEWIGRSRLARRGKVKHCLEKIQEKRSLPAEITQSLPRDVLTCAKAVAEIVSTKNDFSEERIEELIQSREEDIVWEISKVGIWIRLGPALGLMGTLIPMGTGLSALADGNMAQLSSSLIIAFTTTVVGLLIGIFAYFFVMVKERWFKEDVRSIRLITEALTKGLL